jgi:hypothetical protein
MTERKGKEISARFFCSLAFVRIRENDMVPGLIGFFRQPKIVLRCAKYL